MSSQTADIYPTNPVITRQPDSSHSGGGSFGPVFAVLAVIVVISAVACVLGRLCSRRHHRGGSKEKAGHPPKAGKQSHGGLGPKEWETRQKPSFNMRDGDIEFGFDSKRMPSATGAKNGGGKGKPNNYNGAHKPEVRFADNV